MDSLSFKTNSVSKYEISKRWLLIDATDKSLGRLASTIAQIIIGKHKILFTPNINCGDHIIVINAEKISLKGNNWKNRKYISYTGYPGGKKCLSVFEQFNKNPIVILEKAVKGMLPKTRLGNKLYKNLHVYVGKKHKHVSQTPIVLNIN
ncbi:MAG: 50S ribosomal protein L13 [Candidatus Walczuchella monophlebidarum]